MQKLLEFDRKGTHYSVFRFGDSATAVKSGNGATVKDIGAAETIDYAVSQGANVIVNVTQGNNGHALMQAVLDYNAHKPPEERVKVVHIINYNEKLDNGLADHQAVYWQHGFSHCEPRYSLPAISMNLHRRWLTPEDRVREARQCLKEHRDPQFDVSGIIDVTHHIPNEYIKQAEQVLQSALDGRYLDCLAIPVGTGRTFIAFYNALNNLRGRGIKINTKLIGIVPKGENPIYHKFVFEERREDGSLEHVIRNFHALSRADKLSCPWTDLMPQLEEANRNGHMFIQVENKSVTSANGYAYRAGRRNNVDLRLEDSGSVGFSLLEKRIREEAGIIKGQNVGIFVTGMGLYATPSWALAEMESKRRLHNLKVAGVFISLVASLLAADYLGRRFSPSYRKQSQVNYIYYQEFEMMRQLIGRDKGMVEALNEIRKSYDPNHSIQYDDYDPSIREKIIRKYWENNRNRLRNSSDPNDRATFERLRRIMFLAEHVH